jgi:hypothetical protein
MPQCGALSLLQKTPHYRGVGEITARLNVKLWVLMVVTGGGFLPPSRPVLYIHRNKKPTRSGPFRGSFAGDGLCFCTSRFAARCPARVARCPKRAATQTAPGRAAVGQRRVFLPQARTAQTFVNAGAPAATCFTTRPRVASTYHARCS